MVNCWFKKVTISTVLLNLVFFACAVFFALCVKGLQYHLLPAEVRLSLATHCQLKIFPTHNPHYSSYLPTK